MSRLCAFMVSSTLNVRANTKWQNGLYSRFCKLFSEGFTGTPSLLPVFLRPRQAKLISQQNLLYKAFCHLVGMYKMKACSWEENLSLQERDARLKCRRSTKPTRSLCWRRTQSNLSNITGGSSAGYSQKALESTRLISCLTSSGTLGVSWSPSTIKRLVRNNRLFVPFFTEIWKE